MVVPFPQYTKEKSISEAIRAARGRRLRDDSSFELVDDDDDATNGTGLETNPNAGNEDGGSEQRPLLLKVYPDDDHFWGTQGANMVEFVLAWCSSIANAST